MQPTLFRACHQSFRGFPRTQPAVITVKHSHQPAQTTRSAGHSHIHDMSIELVASICFYSSGVNIPCIGEVMSVERCVFRCDDEDFVNATRTEEVMNRHKSVAKMMNR